MEKEEALKLADSKWWEKFSDAEIADFQLREPLLCMPFSRFHEATEKAIGRPIYTHEFADPTSLLKEIKGIYPKRTIEDILALIPKEKLVVIKK